MKEIYGTPVTTEELYQQNAESTQQREVQFNPQKIYGEDINTSFKFQTPVEQPIGNMFLPYGGVKPIDEKITTVEGLYDIPESRAQAQSGVQLGLNALGQLGAGVVLGLPEMAGYIADFEEFSNFDKQKEEGFDNAFSKEFREAREYAESEYFPIYRSHQSQADNLWDRMGAPDFWAQLGPQAATSINSAILGVAAGSLTANPLIGATVAALANTKAEAAMQAGSVFRSQYDQFLNETNPVTGQLYTDKEAREKAGQMAASSFKGNIAMIPLNMLEYAVMIKPIGQFVRGMPKWTGVPFQMTMEGGQEFYQNVVDEEAIKSVREGITPFGTGFGERLGDYIKDPDNQEAALMGAIGGGIFEAGGKFIQKQVEKVKANGVAKDISSQFNDKETFDKIDNQMEADFLQKAARYDKFDSYMNAAAGYAEAVKNKEGVTPEEIQEATTKTQKLIENAEYVKKAKQDIKEINPEYKNNPNLATQYALNKYQDKKYTEKIDELNSTKNKLTATTDNKERAINLGIDIAADQFAKTKVKSSKISKEDKTRLIGDLDAKITSNKEKLKDLITSIKETEPSFKLEEYTTPNINDYTKTAIQLSALESDRNLLRTQLAKAEKKSAEELSKEEKEIVEEKKAKVQKQNKEDIEEAVGNVSTPEQTQQITDAIDNSKLPEQEKETLKNKVKANSNKNEVTNEFEEAPELNPYDIPGMPDAPPIDVIPGEILNQGVPTVTAVTETTVTVPSEKSSAAIAKKDAQTDEAIPRDEAEFDKLEKASNETLENKNNPFKDKVSTGLSFAYRAKEGTIKDGKTIDSFDQDGNIILNDDFNHKLLEPDFMQAGSTITFKIDTENEQYEGFKNDINNVPIVIIDENGDKVGYVHTIEWLNDKRNQLEPEIYDYLIAETNKVRGFFKSNISSGSDKSIEAKKADIERRRQEDLETTKNIGENKLREGRENTKKLIKSLKQRYPATSIQGIIIRILEKLIDFNKYSTIIDSEYLANRNANGQATWYGMILTQEAFDNILLGKEFDVHTFIHEFIHGFTTSKISDYNIEKQGLIPGFKSKLTAKEKNAIEQLQRIFEKVKRDNPKTKEYGFTNLDEFIAEAFSNVSFQNVLKNTKTEGKKSNLFSEFISAIGDLLFEQLERWAKRFNEEIPQRDTITGILEDILAWTEELIDENNKLAYIATNEEINAKYDAELAALDKATQAVSSSVFTSTVLEKSAGWLNINRAQNKTFKESFSDNGVYDDNVVIRTIGLTGTNFEGSVANSDLLNNTNLKGVAVVIVPGNNGQHIAKRIKQTTVFDAEYGKEAIHNVLGILIEGARNKNYTKQQLKQEISKYIFVTTEQGDKFNNLVNGGKPNLLFNIDLFDVAGQQRNIIFTVKETGSKHKFSRFKITLENNVPTIKRIGFSKNVNDTLNIAYSSPIPLDQVEDILFDSLKNKYLNIDSTSALDPTNFSRLEANENFTRVEPIKQDYRDFLSDKKIATTNIHSIVTNNGIRVYATQPNIVYSSNLDSKNIQPEEPITPPTEPAKPIDTTGNDVKDLIDFENIPDIDFDDFEITKSFLLDDLDFSKTTISSYSLIPNLQVEKNLIQSAVHAYVTKLAKNNGDSVKAIEDVRKDYQSLREEAEAGTFGEEIDKKVIKVTSKILDNFEQTQVGDTLFVGYKTLILLQADALKFSPLTEEFNSDEDTTAENFDADRNFKADPEKSASARIKRALFFLPEYKDGKISRNALGQPIYKDYYKVFNTIMNATADIPITQIRGELNELATELSITDPHNIYQQVLEVLDKNTTNDTLVNEFHNVFTKQRILMQTLIIFPGKDGNLPNNIFRLSNKSGAAGLILDQWKETHNKSTVVNKDGSYNKAEVAKLISKLNTAVKDSKPEEFAKEISDILNEVGIEVSKEAISKLHRDYINNGKKNPIFTTKINNRSFITFKNELRGQLLYIFDSINNSGKIDSESDTGISNSIFLTQAKQLDLFAKYEALVNPESLSSSFRNGNGDVIYGFVNPSYLSNTIFEIKNDINNFKREDAFSKHATWNKTDTAKTKLELNYFDAAVNGDKSVNKEAADYESMSDIEKEQFKAAGILSGTYKKGTAFFTTLTPSDKTTFPLIKAVKKVITKDNIVDGKLTIDSPIVKELYDLLVQSEIDRINENATLFNEAKRTGEWSKLIEGEHYVTKNNKKLVGARGYFYLVPQLNAVLKPFLEEINNTEGANLTLGETASSQAKQAMVDQLNRLMQAKFDKWNKIGMFDRIDNKYHTSLLNLFNQTERELNPNIIKQYTVADFVINNAISYANQLMLISGDTATFATTKNWDGTPTDAAQLVDDTVKNMFKRIAKDIAPGYEGLFDIDEQNYNVLFINEPKKSNKAYTEYEGVLRDQLLALKGIKFADAQKLTTVAEHIKTLCAIGRISKETKKKYLDKYKNNEDFTDTELGIILQPLKPVEVGRTTNVSYYIKSSSYPLLPQLTRGLDIDALRVFMEENNIDAIVPQTAVKLGFHKAVTIFKDDRLTIGKDGKLIADGFTEAKGEKTLSPNLHILNREFFRIQQDVPYDPDKSKILEGSQLKKLKFSDLDYTLDFDLGGKKYKGHELKELDDKIHIEIYQRHYDELGEKLKAIKQGKYYSSPDIQVLKEMMIKEAATRGFDFNDLMLLDRLLDGSGFAQIPLFMHPALPKIEALLNSIIKNNVLVTKFPGKSYVQGTSLGFEGGAYGTEEVMQKILAKTGIVLTSEFNQNDGLNYVAKKDSNGNEYVEAQVFLPWFFKEDISAFLTPLGTLDTTKIDSKLLELIGYRIPTQDHGSMVILKPVGFLPKECGDLIIVPPQMSELMGSDFDVDKLYVHRFNYTAENGRLNYLKPSSEDINKLSMEELQNLSLEITHSILHNTEVAKRMLTPLDNTDVQDVLDEINSIKPTKKEVNTENLEFTKGSLGIGKEIASYSDNLEFALTNPTHTSPTGYDWKRQWSGGQTQWRNYLSKGIKFNEIVYKDVEEAYQKNKHKYSKTTNLFGDKTTDDLMLELLTIKLNTYPELIKGIEFKGGLKYLLDSTHQPTNKNSHWETGGDNAFIKILAKAYLNIKNESFDESIPSQSGVIYDGLHSAFVDINAAGKVGIGVGSVASTSHVLAQYTGLYIQKIFRKDGVIDNSVLFTDKKGNNPFTDHTGVNHVKQDSVHSGMEYKNAVSKGLFRLDRIYGITKKRISQVIKNIQTEAVDNAKNQRLFGMNLNAYTFDTALFLAKAGLDEQYLGMFLNQPIIKEYIDKLSKQSDIGNSEYTFGYEEKAQEELFSKYGNSAAGPYLLSLEEMKDNIAGNIDKDFQTKVLASFIIYSKQAKSLTNLFKAINTDTKYLDKDIVSTLKKSADNTIYFENQKLFGNTKGLYSTLQKEAYDLGVEGSLKLYADLFPYNSEFINNVENNISALNPDVETLSQKDRESINKAVKNAIWVNAWTNTFEGDVNSYRQSLLFGDKSIANQLSKVKETSNNDLVKLLIPISSTDSKTTHTIEFPSAGSLEEGFILRMQLSFLELYKNPKTTNFAENLVGYVITNGNERNARDFSRFIPIDVYQDMGLLDSVKRTYNDVLNDKDGQYSARLVEQYLQHNPAKAFKVTKEQLGVSKLGSVIEVDLESNPGLYRDYIFVYEEGAHLYKLNGNAFVKIPLLGNKKKFITEYDLSTEFKGSLFENNNKGVENFISAKLPKTNVVITKEKSFSSGIEVMNYYNFKEGKNLKQVLETIIDTSNNAGFVELAKILASKPSVEQVNIVKGYPAGHGNSLGSFVHDTNTLYVNPSKIFNQGKKSMFGEISADELFQLILLHETIHSIADRELMNNPNGEFSQQMSAIFKQWRDNTTRADLDKITDTREFMARLFTDPRLQEDLSSMKTGNKNFLQQIWDIITKLIIGDIEVKSDSLLADALKSGLELIEGKKSSMSGKEVYKLLGNKTQSENVVIKSWGELKDVVSAILPQGVVATRIRNTSEHFGNPFSHDPAGKTQGLIKTETVQEAVEKYTDWVINSEDSRAKWIREQLKSGILKGKPILYYKELGEPSHATALDYLINKYSWIEGKKDSFESRVEESLTKPRTNLPIIEPGRYVKYKNDTYIVTKLNTNGTVQIYNPLLEGASAKISVSEDNLITMSSKADIVNYRDSEYIVTDKGNIISLTTNKLMKWGEENGDRKNILKLAQVEKETKETIAPVKGNSITFNDGTSISTGKIKLNSQQEEALKQMADFVTNPNKKFFTLKGYAGTGKTTILNILRDYINKKSAFRTIINSSPTHRANAVMLQNGATNVRTLHSVFGLSPEIDLETFDAKDTNFIQENQAKIKYGDLLVIDESSMINDELYNFIIDQAKNNNVQVLFVGDPAQLKPVKQKHLSKVFDIVKDSYELTKVERTGNNPLLKESMDLRNKTNKGDFSFKTNINANNEGIVFTKSSEKFLESALNIFNSEEFSKNPLLIRILSATNNNVEELNQKIRRGLWGENAKNEYNEGEILMGYSNWKVDRETGRPLLANSGDYQVVSVENTTKIIKNKEFKGYNLLIQDLIDKSSTPFKAFMISKNTSVEDFTFLGEVFEQLRNQAKNAPNKRSKAAGWQALSNFKEEFMTPVDIKYKGATKIPTTLKYGYSHTIHKSQGGTYRYSFVNGNTIDSAFYEDIQLNNQLKYVALTRAEQATVILTNKGDVSEIPKLKNNSVSDLIDETLQPQQNTLSLSKTKQDIIDNLEFYSSKLEGITEEDVRNADADKLGEILKKICK